MATDHEMRMEALRLFEENRRLSADKEAISDTVAHYLHKIERLRLALVGISQRMNYGTMTAEMRYAKTVADETLEETK